MVAPPSPTGGVVMQPFVVDRVVGPDGKTVTRTEAPRTRPNDERDGTRSTSPERWKPSCRRAPAPPRRFPGIRVAGKTGTAETGRQGLNQTAFIAFAPAEAPAGRDRRDAGKPERDRRLDRGPDRQTGPAGPPAEANRRLNDVAATDTLINTLFDGRYQIIRKLGSGGMANVYLAEDQELGRRVAIKILNERHANDEQFVERFRREAKNAAGALAPEHRRDLRPRRGGGHLLHRDGVPRRPLAEGADRRARAGAGARRDRLRAPDPRRAALRAPQRDRPPRHQAAQRDRRRRGAASR